ncbi:hypothetical protein [Tissierella sp.]|uniref:hypothetical protein n=1 Tax=Tissierella sp. TaxID=41274 RepID=UPI00285EFA7A|nr:hypothetical protein [Tissierella sp.]MDR7855398.1 hypothetical protein [Tissierella sp.]
MKAEKSNIKVNKIFEIIILLLFITNVYFYSNLSKLRTNANYISSIPSAISIAAHDNDRLFLSSRLVPHDIDNLMNKFEEISSKIARQYSVKNYIVVEYNNGNDLIIKTTENEEGKILIEDMFLLDESIYEKMKSNSRNRN